MGSDTVPMRAIGFTINDQVPSGIGGNYAQKLEHAPSRGRPPSGLRRGRAADTAAQKRRAAPTPRPRAVAAPLNVCH